MKYKVIIETKIADRPEDHELSAALVIANYFKTDVVFLRPQTHKTPDMEINGAKWEIKSPRGNGKKTIDNNLRSARKQSRNIIIDLRRIKLHQNKTKAHINHYLSSGPHGFKKILIITKTNNVIEIL